MTERWKPPTRSQRGGGRRPLESLTSQTRSWRVRAHEADLPAEEGEAQQDARFPQAKPDARWTERAEASPCEGAQASGADLAVEVVSPRQVRFPKAARLLRRHEFLAVQERGARLHAGKYVVLGLPNGRGHARLGITVSSKVANAVGRNLVKRWVREAFRAAAAELPAVDLVIIARSGTVEGGLVDAAGAFTGARRTLARGG
jgi:ribonuclease P protein component